MPELTLLTLESGLWIASILVVVAMIVAGLTLVPLWLKAEDLRRGAAKLKALEAGSDRAEGIVAEVSERFLIDWKEGATDFRGRAAAPIRLDDYVSDRDAFWFFPNFFRGLVTPMSGILLALGIFFTFLGITLGLQNIDTSDSALLLEGVRQLLQGMNVAFVTSLAGIGLAVLWIPASRSALGAFHGAIAKLDREVHRHFPWAPLGEIQLQTEIREAHRRNEFLKRQIQIQEEQKSLLQTLGIDIAEAVAGRFQASMEETLVPVLERLRQEFQGFAANQAARQEQSMDKLVSDFQAGLQDHLDTHLESMTEALSQAGNHIERFHVTVGRTLGQLSELSTSQAELLNASTEAVREFSEGVDGLATLHGLIKQSMQDYAQAAESLRELVQGMRGEAEVLSSSNATLRDELASHLDLMSEQVKGIESALTRFENSTDKMVPKLENAVTEFTGLAADKLAEVFHTFDGEMATVTDRLNNTLHAMRVNIDELTPTTERLNSSVEQLVGPVTSSRTSLDQISSDLQASHEATDKLVHALQELTKNGVERPAETASPTDQQRGSRDDGVKLRGFPTRQPDSAD